MTGGQRERSSGHIGDGREPPVRRRRRGGCGRRSVVQPGQQGNLRAQPLKCGADRLQVLSAR
eukprot:8268259-Pyramimonas_sp.AAC.1